MWLLPMFVLLVPVADVKHCLRYANGFCVSEWNVGGQGMLWVKKRWQVILHVAGTDWTRFWPRHASHVMCSLVPKWCTPEALIATE